jgi:predicted Zn-dependent protease
MPFNGLLIEAGGDQNELVCFSHPGFSGWSIYTSSQDIVDHRNLTQRMHLKEQIAQLRYQRDGISAHVLWTFGIVFGLVLAVLVLWLENDNIMKHLVASLPAAWEADLGKSLFSDAKKQFSFVDDLECLKMLRALGSKLQTGLGPDAPKFQYYIVEDPEINAQAIPGGYVLVNTGLLAAVKRPEELAGVLAHELAHITERHGFRQIADSAGPSLMIHYLFRRHSFLTGIIAAESHLLARQRFSRKYEREADQRGWEYLVRAKIDPRGLSEFFQMMLKMERHRGGSLWDSHPPTEERLDYLRSRWENLTPKPSFTRLPLMPCASDQKIVAPRSLPGEE